MDYLKFKVKTKKLSDISDLIKIDFKDMKVKL